LDHRAKRLFLLGIGLFPVVLICLLLVFWARDHIEQWLWWKAALVCLIVVEIAYVLAAAIAVSGAAVLGCLALSLRNQPGRAGVGRWCLLCVSLSIGIITVEIGCSVRRHRSHRSTELQPGPQRSVEELVARQARQNAARDRGRRNRSTEPGAGDAIDIVVLGESSAEGVPFSSWLSIGRIVCWQLQEAMPERAVHLWNLAVSGATLERQEERLRAATLRPDAVIIYCGHNEFSSRFAASRAPSHYLDEGRRPAWTIVAEWIERTSATCGLLRETAEKCRIAIPPSRAESRPLVDVPVYTRGEFDTVLDDFRRRLDAMVTYVEQLGAIPVLIAPAANDAGFEPNRSYLAAETPRLAREEFARDLRAARRSESDDPGGSLDIYRALLTREPTCAEAHFRIARLLERGGRWDEAYRHYVLARDLDGYPMRMPSGFQDVYRETAARHGSILIDAQSLFHAIGPHGLLDDQLFQDGIHPSFRGQIALAQAVLQALCARRAFACPDTALAPVIDPEWCAAHFKLGPEEWRMVCLWGVLFGDLTYRLRFDPSERLEKKRAYAMAADQIAAGAAPESVGLPNVGIPPPVPVVTGP
jgi:lysophospholipase L1-like esterase